jgi:hypothetical protein
MTKCCNSFVNRLYFLTFMSVRVFTPYLHGPRRGLLLSTNDDLECTDTKMSVDGNPVID